MPVTNPDKPLCALCNKRNAQDNLDGKCRACYDAERAFENLPEALRNARKQKDWVRIAEELAETYKGIADGSIKATAAQARILTTIWDRAYGRPSKTQDDVMPSHGVVVLPTLGYREKMYICPTCGNKYEETQTDTDVSSGTLPIQSE